MITMLARIWNFWHVTNNTNRRKKRKNNGRVAAVATNTINFKENGNEYSQKTTNRTWKSLCLWHEITFTIFDTYTHSYCVLYCFRHLDWCSTLHGNKFIMKLYLPIFIKIFYNSMPNLNEVRKVQLIMKNGFQFAVDLLFRNLLVRKLWFPKKRIQSSYFSNPSVSLSHFFQQLKLNRRFVDILVNSIDQDGLIYQSNHLIICIHIQMSIGISLCIVPILH